MSNNISRKDFLKMCGILGISLPFSSFGGGLNNQHPGKFNGKVIVIGAGVGGLSSGYFLNQMGIDFQILEASSNYGGRIKINKNFADYPIPLGAEWIETRRVIFEEIVNDPSKEVDIETFRDRPDFKFRNYSWLSFYEDFIIPSISDKIKYKTIVKSINYSGDQIRVHTQNETFVADKVIVAVPLKILQDGDITFTPSLPENKLKAIKKTVIWSGFKAFFEFTDNFFEEGKEFEITPETDGQKLYYDAGYGQNTSQNILGLFAVGKPAEAYTSLSEGEVKTYILKELDQLFEGQASTKYMNHIVQNWNNEPFIKGGYMTDHASYRTVEELGKSVNNQLFFAGGAYTDGGDWVSVHAAARSAKRTIEEMIGEIP